MRFYDPAVYDYEAAEQMEAEKHDLALPPEHTVRLPCPECCGTGELPGAYHMGTCWRCRGEGEVWG